MLNKFPIWLRLTSVFILLHNVSLAEQANVEETLFPFKTMAIFSDKVVLGQIIRMDKTECNVIERKYNSCPVYLEMKVLNSWKGGKENFVLYLKDTRMVQEEFDTYLIFASNPAKLFENQVTQSEDGEKCKIDTNVGTPIDCAYIADFGQQHLFPIDFRKDSENAEDWLVLKYDPKDKKYLFPDKIRYNRRINDIYPSGYSVVNMNDFLSYVLHE